MTRRTIAEPIAGKARRRRVEITDSVRDQQKHAGGENASDDLGDHVADHSVSRELAAEIQSEGDSRVEMAARDRAHCVDHRQERKAKGERNARVTDMVASENGAAASAKYEDKRSDQFRQIDPHRP